MSAPAGAINLQFGQSAPGLPRCNLQPFSVSVIPAHSMPSTRGIKNSVSFRPVGYDDEEL